MKEIELPTKDLKNGAKVVKTVGSSIFDAVKPSIARSIERNIIKLRKRSSRLI